MDANRGYRTTMIKGAYQLRVIDSGKCISDTGEVRNLILNEALNHGDPFSSGFICVGDGDSEPYSTQVALDNQLGQVSGTFSNDATIFMDGQDRYSRRAVTVSLTGISGDIREVGFKKLSNGDLLSRTLIRDGNGTVTWVPLQSHQVLEVTFFVYFRIPNIIASGSINTPYGQTINYTIRPTDQINSPKGILGGRFDDPFGGNDLIMLSIGGDVAATSVDIEYDQESAECTVIAYWQAEGYERSASGFLSDSNADNFPEIVLSEDLIIPVDHDVTLSFVFSRD